MFRAMSFTPPPPDCPLCPRLVAFREQNRINYPAFFNAPVPPFGELNAQLLIVGLAPGLQGANQTGRPFTGDYAGIILYDSLLKSGFAEGDYLATLPESVKGRIREGGNFQWKSESQGGFRLHNCRITNAVRCVPPENKPENDEIKQCNVFLKNEIAAMPNLKVITSLGLISHNAVLKATGHKVGYAKFTHGGMHKLTDTITLLDTYHCSRYNINTGRLTQAMFDEIIERAKKLLGA